MTFVFQDEPITPEMEQEVKFRETLARIDLSLADRDQKRQMMQFAPWQLMFTGIGAGAALLAAAITLVKTFWH